ncbi:DUF2690 domain-containing protein [Leifsonia sp. TF02-11]|uniref:DUF2690 domain-containing protein n=1 Tax=Leifsonia sp. TF02-11 TaxID=2815212 RepID=UPI001AA1B8FE|nr:DUF2690 domain-containing protein [Leifsonia sp. TF02-11]MBO1741412.1 DUF2690 domain-containing protein [Leifsonia sp. TF02-11]
MTDQDDPADSVATFASDLRMLRIAAGSPTLASLQHETGISRTVISDAFAGKQLPSARTVDGIVRACKGDTNEWLRRRDLLDPKQAADAPLQPTRRGPGRPRWSIVSLIAVIAFVLGAAVAGGVTSTAMGSQVHALQAKLKAAGPVNPNAQIIVRTGVDPAMTPCVNDAKVAASEDRPDNTRIQIVWSNKCYAGWARIARYDGKAEGNEVQVSIYPETAPHGPDRQDATEPGVQGAYTMLVVRPSPQTRLCAVGSITLDGKTISLGDPICT